MVIFRHLERALT